MQITITKCDDSYAIVQVSEIPDGVNTPQVFEFIVGRGLDDSDPPKWMLEVRAGTSVEFAEHDDDAESFPDTIAHFWWPED